MKNSLLHSLTFFLSLILLLVFVSSETVCGQPENTEIKEPDNLYALSACLMDAESGRVLFEKNGEEKRANASTTKTMTLIVTLENADLEDVVTVSEYAARAAGRPAEYQYRGTLSSQGPLLFPDARIPQRFRGRDSRTCGRQRGRLCKADE